MLHSEVLPDHSLELLRKISPALAEEGFYLAGGTALALRLGHRVSVDLDFFSEEGFDPNQVASLLIPFAASPPKVVQQTSGSLCVVMEGTKVEFLHYPYPPLSEASCDEGILLASLEDIGAMKLSAMTNRGAKKDFIDVAAMLGGYSLGELLRFHEAKFPQTDLFAVVKSLTWFDDAEEEPDPKLLLQQTWEGVKAALSQAVAEEGEQ